MGKGKETAKKQHPCDGCFHWRGSCRGGFTCNFLFDTGHRRPSPPGERCICRREIKENERAILQKLKKML